MKNKRGIGGIINQDGIAGSPSYIVDPRSIDFLDEIEDGIKETVQSLIDNKYVTFSSCEGHGSPRTVSIVVEKNQIGKWVNYISYINENNETFPVTYMVLEIPPNKFEFIDELFKEPIIIMVEFGIVDIDEVSTIKGQIAFNADLKKVSSFSPILNNEFYRRGIESHVNTY